MTDFSDSEQEQFYSDFLNEVRELLQVIEQELLGLRQDRTQAKVHNLMRAAHTLKGSSASVGLNSLSQIAHGLEGIFKSFYNPDLTIDVELETLLCQAYESLRVIATKAMAGLGDRDLEGDLNQAAGTLAQIQAKLGDDFNPEAAIPSSEELGFDMVQSIFEVGVTQRLEELASTLSEEDPIAVAEVLQNCLDIFMGLAESLNLPGFGVIVTTAQAALSDQPEAILAIAEAAFMDFYQAQQDVLAGDRTSGGAPSSALIALAEGQPPPKLEADTTFAAEEPVEWLDSNLSEPDGSPVEAETNPTNTTDDETILLYPNTEVISSPSQESEDLPQELEVLADVESDAINFPEGEVAAFEVSPAEVSEPFPSIESNIPSLEQVFGTFDPETFDDFTAQDSPSEALAPPELEIPPPTVEQSTREIVEEPPPPVPQLQSVRVNLQQLERLNFQAGELLINQNKQVVQNEQLLAAMQELRSRLEKHQNTLDRLRAWGVKGENSSSNRLSSLVLSSALQPSSLSIPQLDSLEFDRYSELQILLQDALTDMVQMGETAELFELLARQASQTIEKQQRLLASVRDDLTQTRMQQFGEILKRTERLVQQLATTYGKPVEFEISGSGVPIDKAIAQKLYDPLLHLVRNAFAHGIESPEERRELGKPERGTIRICAYNQGNRTLLEVSDDGRGIDFEAIRDRAVELDLVAASDAIALTESQLLHFIFQPGFSTAREANDLYGRGVGLDVVRANLEAIEANLTANSQPQVGTTFIIRLPLTLSVAKLLVCEAGGLSYALPSDSIEQIVLLQRDRIQSIGDRRVLQWQHNLRTDRPSDSYTIPLYRLSDLLDYRSSLVAPSSSDTLPMAILLQAPSGLVSLEVDRVAGERELAIRPLGRAITPPDYVDGCSILGSSRLALVIDAIALIEQTLENSTSAWARDEDLHLTTGATSPQLPPAPTSPTVLVVDDSITLRQNATRTLQKSGYQVLQAQDGLDAIAQLQQHKVVDVILCDLEMPRMNGFEFLNACCQEPEFRDIPTIILTSRQGEKHRQIALGLGAADYLTKPYLERDLLNAIAQQLAKE